MEEWAEIEGYPLYKIRRDGLVWSKQWNRPLKQSDHAKPKVSLLSEETWKHKSFRVEDLLKKAFGDV